MTEWIFCYGDFIAADVIRWKEPVWEKRGPKQGRAMIIGDRLVTAQVLREEEDSGFVILLVMACEVLLDKSRRKTIQPLEKNKEIARKRKSLEKGRPERMLWEGDGECVRAGLVTKPEKEREKRLRG
jgi:hypothetical protein